MLKMRTRGRVAGLIAAAFVAFAIGACGEEPPPSDGTPDGGAPGDGDGDGDGNDGGNAGARGESGGDGAGGSGDGGSNNNNNREPLELLDQYPESGDKNASTHEPIELGFSAPLDETSARAAISVRIAGEKVDFAVQVDGAKIRLTLDEIPSLPAQVSVAIASVLKSVTGQQFAGDSFGFSYPLWHTSTDALEPTEGELVLTRNDDEVLLLAERNEGITLHARRDRSWHSLPPLAGPGTRPLAATHDDDGRLLAIYLDDGRVRAASFTQGEDWAKLEATLETGDDAIVVGGQGTQDELVVAWASNSTVQIAQLEGDSFLVYTPFDLDQNVKELSVAADDDGLLLAAVKESGSIQVLRATAEDWTSLGGDILRERSGSAARPTLRFGDALYLSYLDGDEISNNAQVKRWTDSWETVGRALDLNIDDEADLATMMLDETGKPIVSWWELSRGVGHIFVAKVEKEGFRFLGTAATSDVPRDARQLALTLAKNDHPLIAVSSKDGISLARFNGSPTLPQALKRVDQHFTFPEDGPNFPRLLSETSCYQDLATARPMASAIPYTVNSPLWSDGAAKQRYVVVPQGKTVEFRESGVLGLPTGTILIKEFLIEGVAGDSTTLRPMETRFLVKRCEPEDDGCAAAWQGYSYMWNDAGTEGTLLDDAAVKAWSVVADGVPTTHDHIYPSRTQCADCHKDLNGGTIGLSAVQLNRPQLYGDVIENQLRAWEQAGLFGDTGPSRAPEESPFVPTPADVTRSLEERTAGYLHANCAHCHQPNGQRPTPDLSWFGPGLEELVCSPAQSSKLLGSIVVPGKHAESVLYQRDEARDGAAGIQMPNLATFLPDDRQLKVTAAWIDSLQGVCP